MFLYIKGLLFEMVRPWTEKKKTSIYSYETGTEIAYSTTLKGIKGIVFE
jgi:hypothetical protein